VRIRVLLGLLVALLLTVGVVVLTGEHAGDGTDRVSASVGGEASSGDDAAPTAATAAPSTSSTAPTTTLPPPRSATLVFTGDIIPHAPVVRQATADAGGSGYDFAGMLAPVAPLISGADLAICHLETPIHPERAVSGYPVFNAPPQLADALVATGYDGCSFASNHSLDATASGVVATLDVLDAAGLGHAGAARTAEEAATPRLYDAGGIRIAHLSSTYGLNGFSLPADRPWLVNLNDAEAILGQARAARAAGAEIVIASIHWGVEYQRDPTAEQRALAEQLLADPDIDLIIGHHAHVVQPVGMVGFEYVVYGLGNFLTNQSANCCVAASQDGVIVQVTVGDAAPGGPAVVQAVDAVPTWVDRARGYRVLPVLAGIGDPATAPEVRAELERSRDRTLEALTLFGLPVAVS
jgi:hypothetical protein